MASRRLTEAAEIVMGQSPPGECCNAEGLGLPLLNGPTEFGPHHPSPVQFTTDARKRARPDDVLFCVRGSTTGRMNWADREYAIGRGVAAIRHRTRPELQPFVRAVIEYALPGLLAQATGSTFPNVSADQLADIPWPQLEENEQRAIAHILGTLDDKIELNRRMSETLEAMARALFKSWFVDFEPVRAKMEGRWQRGQSLPGLPAHLYDLFPDSFEDSELGEIPRGWEIRKMGDLLELAYGKALKAEDRRVGEVPVYGSNGQVGWHDEPLVRGPGIVVGRKGNPGIVTWAPTNFFVIDTAFYVVPKDTCHSIRFLFHALEAHDLESLSSDSAVPGLNRSLAYMSPQLLPSPPLLQKFDEVARSLDERVHKCSHESRTLAALRDELLPKLISGKIRLPAALRNRAAQAGVKDAERFMKDRGL